MLEETKKTIRLIIIAILLVIIIYFATVFTFVGAGARSRGNEKQITQLAESKTPIVQVNKYYHLDRGVSSYSLSGTDKKGKQYYFIYRTHRRKAYLYPTSKGVSENSIRQKFKRENSGKIRSINLGWYHGQAVWEVAFSQKSGLGYQIYSFKDGKSLSRIENL